MPRRSAKTVSDQDEPEEKLLTLDEVELEESSPKPPRRRKPTGKTSMSVNDYDHLPEEQRVLARPNVYIDSVQRHERTTLTFSKKRFKKMTIDVPLGLERIFMELWANVCDHIWTSREEGVDPGEPSVTYDRASGVITVTSHGLPVPIGDIHPETGKHVLELILGTLGAGSNFNLKKEGQPVKKRHGAGANGLGAKAANIYSSRFQIVAINPETRLKYTQVWTGNMALTEGGTVSEPRIEKVSRKESKQSLFEVTYQADLARFGYDPDQGYPEEMEVLLKRHMLEASFTARVATHFNGTRFNCPSIIEYAKLHFGSGFDSNYLVHYEWDKIDRKKGNIQVAKDGVETARNGARPNVELIVVDLDGYNGETGVSMVNCVVTPDGGVHLDTAQAAALADIISYVNELVLGSKAKAAAAAAGGGGRGRAAPGGRGRGRALAAAAAAKAAASAGAPKVQRLTLKDAKAHVGIIVSFYTPDPDWGAGNTKLSLRGPKPDICIAASKLAKMRKWSLYDKLLGTLRGRGANILSKTDGSKVADLGKIKGDDATYAGTARWKEATLAGLEGDSAMQYFNFLLEHWPGKRARLGAIPFRGKLINALKNDLESLAANKELARLKKMLGIREGVDYTIEANMKSRKGLRYGKFMIMTDADVDGSHIKGLIIAMFARLWGSLLSTDFIEIYQTPVKRAYRGKTITNFYFEHEFREWQRTTPGGGKGWQVEHFKGLGGSSAKEVAMDYQNIHNYGLKLGKHGLKHIHMAFGAGSVQQRKKWLAKPAASYVEPVGGKIRVTDFVNCELKLYALDSLVRHLTGFDGLRRAQRKAIYAALQHWRRNPKPKEMPMTSFVSTVLVVAKYVNGPAISDVIKRQSSTFVGGRNVPDFVFHSAAGTRIEGGKDAPADRYLKIKPNAWWLNVLYPAADDPILNYTTEGDEQAEPARYYPVIPNCSEIWCVATGYSSYIPAHHPLDFVDFFIKKLRGKPTPATITPWYRGFTGSLKVIDRRRNVGGDNWSSSDSEEDPEELEKEEDQEELAVDVRPAKNGRYALMTKGVAHFTSHEDAVVTELPIGLWMRTYKNKLFDMQAKGIIRTFNDSQSDASNVWFEIKGMKRYTTVESLDDEEPIKQQRPITTKDLHITKSYGLTNLVMIDDDCVPIKYESLSDIWEGFYHWRLPLYGKRKDYQLEQLQLKINENDARAAFIGAVLKGELIIIKGKGGSARDEDDIYADIDRLGLDRGYYKKIVTNHYSKQQVAKLAKIRADLVAEMETLEQTPLEALWLADLKTLKEAYIKHYGDDR